MKVYLLRSLGATGIGTKGEHAVAILLFSLAPFVGRGQGEGCVCHTGLDPVSHEKKRPRIKSEMIRKLPPPAAIWRLSPSGRGQRDRRVRKRRPYIVISKKNKPILCKRHNKQETAKTAARERSRR
jgi:hypothetical protein